MGGPFISGLDADTEAAPSRRPYLAFGFEDVSQMALAGIPPRQTELIFGRFDLGATDAALSACADCPRRRARHTTECRSTRGALTSCGMSRR